MGVYENAVDMEAPAGAVRAAIAERGDEWWTTNAIIDSAVGGVCRFRFPSSGFHADVRVTENDDRAEWVCTDASHPPDKGYRDRREWVGTRIRFEFDSIGTTRTKLRFHHFGLEESLLNYIEPNDPWAYFLRSIKQLCETGVGAPHQGGPPEG